jgi:hypothetical protein
MYGETRITLNEKQKEKKKISSGSEAIAMESPVFGEVSFFDCKEQFRRHARQQAD